MPTFDRKTMITAAVLVLITAIPFISVLGNGFTNWDDQLYVTDNPVIYEISWANVKEIFATFYKNDYRLITVLFSYMLEYRFFGLDPFIYHLDNLLLHILNTVLVYYVVRRLTGAHIAAFATALLFGVHPLHVEAVSWISERKGVLSGAFFLASIIFYMRYRDGERTKLFYGLALAAFVLSMLSKLVGVSLPLVLLLIDYLQKRPFDKKAIIEKIPFFAVSAIFALDTIYMYDTMEQLGSIKPLTTFETALLAAKNLFAYIRLTVWPANLSTIYPYPDSVSITDPAFFAPVILLLVCAALVVYSIKHTRLVAFSALFFIVTILPVLKVVAFASGGSTIADRYMYIPSMALLMLAGVLFEKVYVRGRGAMAVASASLAIVVIALSMATHDQNKVWRDSGSLWQNVIDIYPESARPYFNLGNHYVTQGRLDEAVELFLKSLERDPDFVDCLYNLGNTYMKLGRWKEAAAEYERVVALSVGHDQAHYNLGKAYAKLGRYEQAELEYRTAATLKPGHVNAHFNRANALVRLGRIVDALSAYETAVSLAPGRTDILNNQGIAYSLNGDYLRAARSFRAVLEIDPENENAKRNLERALKLSGGSQIQ